MPINKNNVTEFVEIRKLVEEKDGQLAIKGDIIRRDSILSFREWSKSAKEASVQGEITALYVTNTEEGNGRPHRIKIAEGISSFKDRLGSITQYNGQIIS